MSRYAKGVARPAAIVLLGAILVVGALAFAASASLRARRRRTLRGRTSLALQRLDLGPKKPSVFYRIFEKALLSVVTMAANAMVERMKLSVPRPRTA